jgi:hypothetical protein
MVAGALQLDGVDDYVSTGPVLNLADGAFNVLTRVMGGAPGEFVISQEGGVDWLITDAEGNLMTKLRNPGRSGGPLLSQTNTTEQMEIGTRLVSSGMVHTKHFMSMVS